MLSSNNEHHTSSSKNSSEQLFKDLLEQAGITINGKESYDPQIKNPAFYDRFLADGTIGLGESYMEGWRDCEELDVFFDRILQAHLDEKVPKNLSSVLLFIKAKLLNLQNKTRAARDISHHYDIGNDLYSVMLDPRMVYTCGYRDNAENLAQAQEAKLDLVCKKIGLKKGQKVLDIGCGRGSFAKFAAEKYGAKVVGVTISQEQVTLARELCKGLDVDIRFQDYRDVNEQFDHIISIGMFEAVGHKNYATYMEVARRCLKEDGLFLLHTIGRNTTATHIDPWINKYIFPGAVLPSLQQVNKALEGLFIVEDLHNFGPSYDKTLMAWCENFKKNFSDLKGYDDTFYRMWTYYLLSCAGAFRSRDIQLWQMVLSPRGVQGGYTSIR